jgi:hypothetical protein
MEQFKSYLLSKHLTDEKKAIFYESWVIGFFKFFKKKPEGQVSSEEIEHYLKYLSKNREDWQVKQASVEIHCRGYEKDTKTHASFPQN